MRDKVLECINKNNLIEPGDNVLIGVSGGPDSMALLYVLMEIKSIIPFSIYIAHVNHGVRGLEADMDEQFVKEEAQKNNIPYYSKRIDMEGYAREHKLSREDAGRILRYGFFRDIISSLGGGKIAVAHNKNDQAETVMMRFLRGSGIDGLKGMDYISGNVIRPILDISRFEIEDYIKLHKIETRLDRTNLETVYNRNKIRLELIPYIEEHFNPNLVDTLHRTSRIAQMDSDLLQEITLEKYQIVVKYEDKNSIILCKDNFLYQHEGIKFRIIRQCIQNLSGKLQGVTEAHVRNVVELFKGETGKKINIANGIVAKTSYDDLIIKINENEIVSSFNYKIPTGERIYIKELDTYLESLVLPIDKVQLNFNERFIKFFDYDKIKGDLYLRNRKLGDVFTPFGMRGSKKIKDYFIDEKIPISHRDRIPLLVDDNNNILWIIGMRTSELYKITTETKNVLVVKYIKHNDI